MNFDNFLFLPNPYNEKAVSNLLIFCPKVRVYNDVDTVSTNNNSPFVFFSLDPLKNLCHIWLVK